MISYKCGPDYIDPMFHQKVIDVPAKNLDTFFTDEETTRKLFLKNRKEDEFVIQMCIRDRYRSGRKWILEISKEKIMWN